MRDELVPLLDRHIDAFRDKEFVYGQSDCVMFVIRWLKAVGVHTPEPVYASLHEGARFLVALDVPEVPAAVDKVLKRRPLLTARVGDIVSHKDNKALGICSGGPRAVFVGLERGVQFVPLSQCDTAWGVEPCLR